ncbi:MAG: hypothetical protein SGILL_010548, partial [Bacillariaceae sp.]
HQSHRVFGASFSASAFANPGWAVGNSTSLGSFTTNMRNFSTAPSQPPPDAEVAKMVRSIKADLVEADVNHDGKLDAEELKAILRKYPKVFDDHAVMEIGELFYTSRGGESVSHERFMKAIANAIKEAEDAEEEEDAVDEEGGQHRRMNTGISHPLGLGTCSTEYMYGKARGVYSDEELDVKLTHVVPETTTDKMAYAAVGVVRLCFDIVSLWKFGEITQAKVLRRVIFLETVAGIPGFVAAMNRHFRSLRTFTRDGGMLVRCGVEEKVGL